MRAGMRVGLLSLAVGLVGACGDDEGGEGEGEVVLDARLDILVDAAEGVLDGVRSVRASYLVAGSTSCEGLETGRVLPSEFQNLREPVLATWEGPGNPHVLAELPNGNTQVLVECYPTEDGTGDTQAAGCEDEIYLAPEQHLNETVQVRFYPD